MRVPVETLSLLGSKAMVTIAAAGAIRPDIPDGLEAICLKCLEKDPWNRYEHAAHLAGGVLQELLDLGRRQVGVGAEEVEVQGVVDPGHHPGRRLGVEWEAYVTVPGAE